MNLHSSQITRASQCSLSETHIFLETGTNSVLTCVMLEEKQLEVHIVAFLIPFVCTRLAG